MVSAEAVSASDISGAEKREHKVIVKGYSPPKTKNMKTVQSIAKTLAIIAASGTTASAASLDLTSGGSGTINGARFITTDQQPTGSGVIQPFVRLQDPNSPAEGYNANARPVMDDVNTSPSFTHDLLLSAVPVVQLSGISYYEFLLDINQTNANPLLSLDKLQIYTRSTALTQADDLTDLTGSSTLRYDLDFGADNEVLLNYSLNSGSGSGDLLAYIPYILFGSSSQFVYLYSMFGSKDGYTENDGFEEWAPGLSESNPPDDPPDDDPPDDDPPDVPDGGTTIASLGLALLGLGGLRRLIKKD